MVGRGYIGRGVPLLKHIAALPGQEVCRTGSAVAVDAVPFGDALDRDTHGRPLPVWQGCRRIADGDIFLMNPSVPDSLDGRYFGPLPARDLIGKATPLYTDEVGDGRFIWRAATR
jgi:type IV secretory pathway protease TraF